MTASAVNAHYTKDKDTEKMGPEGMETGMEKMGMKGHAMEKMSMKERAMEKMGPEGMQMGMKKMGMKKMGMKKMGPEGMDTETNEEP